jgi:hypothetical protein
MRFSSGRAGGQAQSGVGREVGLRVRHPDGMAEDVSTFINSGPPVGSGGVEPRAHDHEGGAKPSQRVKHPIKSATQCDFAVFRVSNAMAII